jgi:hypothetical protein
MTAITLTADQESALGLFVQFLTDPTEPVFVLSGYSGTGKSTLIKVILERYEGILKIARLINPRVKIMDVVLTATTNKAAEALAYVTGQPAQTIHAYLGLRVETNYESGETKLISRGKGIQENAIIFIDEASYVDKQLLEHCFKLTRNCKIIFMGDPAQLTPIKSKHTPVFSAKFPGAHLSQVVRQAEGNPIIALSTKFRDTVNTGEFFSFKPDGTAVRHMSREAFNIEVHREFNNPNWKYKDSKVLAWTNRCVVGYNHAIRDSVKGDPDFQIGDYAVCNKFVGVGKQSLKTDQMVQITDIGDPTDVFGVMGQHFTLDNTITLFSPKSLADKDARIKLAKAQDDYGLIESIANQWIDLRAAYSCTINKSQGSTFDRVFIDLDDISRCNSGDQIARMLYVGVSRARHQVILTGDFS